MTETEIKQLYAENADFKHYVDECRKADGRTVEEELKLRIVINAAEYYRERGNKK